MEVAVSEPDAPMMRVQGACLDGVSVVLNLAGQPDLALMEHAENVGEEAATSTGREPCPSFLLVLLLFFFVAFGASREL